MKRALVKMLKCPNSGGLDFIIHEGEKVGTESSTLHENSFNDGDDDEIVTGILEERSSKNVYPIVDGIPVMFSSRDIDRNYMEFQFNKLLQMGFTTFSEAINDSLDRTYSNHQTDNISQWNIDEIQYYDDKLESEAEQNRMIQNISDNMLWSRLYQRKKIIIDDIAKEIQAKTVVELGSGNSRTIIRLMHPETFGYNYIGVDLSLNRLKVARRMITQANFIQASAINPPLRNSCVDILIYFGSLHHMPNPEDALKSGMDLLRKGSYLGFHEPIHKPKLLASDSRLKKIFNNYQHSEHDNEIDLPGVLNMLDISGFKLVHGEKSNTILLSLLHVITRLFGKRLDNSLCWTRLKLKFDKIFLKTFSRLSARLGPHAFIGLFHRNNTV